ncbi:hypothetical protein SETIT_9G401500v2 [Setaria italica]|uniref:R3H domain-containing protein n=1 Tax=Setaria italica TaxID=4555 RepID=K4ACF7_SETIT|nr:R3H domain-containing protein 1 [Setaria italica]RCV44775.1 hypothetical protein SETIT_9G401500v2 [Setaria italica]
MATTQFAMVEELASLVKDNLHSKHLILSTEEALIAALQQLRCSDDGGREEVDDAADTIELQPAGAYHRLLLHRLAEIYGFAHESVGEGEDRHLVLQRCPETAIPSVLVSDMLWKFDNSDDSTSVVITRNDTDFQKPWKLDVQEDTSAKSSHLKDATDLKPLKQSVVSPAVSLKEREAAYRAARERIFSGDDAKGNGRSYAKCRQVPVVAQRMIAHALGQKVQNSTETIASTAGRGKQLPNRPNIPTRSRNNYYPVAPDNREENNVRNGKPNSASRNSYQTASSQMCRTANSRAATAESLKKEQTGAARRMFAHALGLSAAQGNYGAPPKPK